MSSFLNNHHYLKRKIALWVLAFPKTLLSDEFSQQVRFRNEHHPGLSVRYRFLRYRDWGANVSITLTDFFYIKTRQIIEIPHPEILAHVKGGSALPRYYKSVQSERGYSEEQVHERKKRTELLLSADPASFFSEVALSAKGEFRITDGHHRASIALLKGHQTYRVVHTVKVHLT